MIDILTMIWDVITLCFTDLFLSCELSFLLYIAMICLVILYLIYLVRGVRSL